MGRQYGRHRIFGSDRLGIRGSDPLTKGLRDRAELHPSQRPLAPRRAGQERGKRQMDDHHRAGHGEETRGAGDVAVVGAPEYFQPRELIRSTLVRPLYNRSNCFVARGMGGKRRRSISCLTRIVSPYFFPALQTSDMAQGNPSCLAGQRYLSVPREGS